MSNCDFLFESFGESSIVSSEPYNIFERLLSLNKAKTNKLDPIQNRFNY